MDFKKLKSEGHKLMAHDVPTR